MESSIYTTNNSNSFNITNDLIVIDTSDNRIGVNTIDPSYSIDVRDLSDVSGIIYTEYLKTGAIISNLTPNIDVCYNLGSQDNKWNEIHTNYLDVSRINFKNQSNENRYFIGLSNDHLVIKDISNDFSVLEADNNTQQVTIPGLARTSDVYSKDYIDNSLNLKANTSDIPTDFYSTSYIDTSFSSVETRLDTLDTSINNIGGGGFDATATPIIIGNNINMTSGPTFLYSFPGPYTQKQTISVSSPLPSSQFSIECKFSTTQNRLMLVGWFTGNAHRQQVSLVLAGSDSNYLYFLLSFNYGGSGEYSAPLNSLNDGQTRHALTTFDGTTAKLYLDSILVVEAQTSLDFNGTTTDLYIGHTEAIAYNGASYEITGDTFISDVKIYDTVITPADLAINDNFIAFNTTNEDINIDASGFYVNPIRNVPDMSYQLFYDVSRNEIVYAEGGGGGFDATATPIIIGNNINMTSGPTFLYSFPGPYTQKQTISVSSPLPSSQFSIECKFSTTQNRLMLVGWFTGNAHRQQVSLVLAGSDSNYLYFLLSFNYGGSGEYSAPLNSLNDGQTRHALTTFDGTTAKLYLDSILVVEAQTSLDFNGTTTDLYIGHTEAIAYNGASYEITGDTFISDVKIYDTVITPADLAINDNFIAFNTTNEDINIDASGFYVNPIRNVPDMSYQLFYDISRNEIVYAEGGGGGGGGFDTTATQIALGYNAGLTNQDVSAIAIGNQSGMTSQSYSSIAIGYQSGMTSQQYQSIAIGYQSGMTSQQRQSIAIGYLSGTTSQSKSSLAIGNQAGNNSQGEHCIAIGSSGGNSGQAEQAIAIGYNAGKSNQNTKAIAIGFNAGSSNQGSGSIGIGTFAGQSQGAQCVAIGNNAGGSSDSYSVAIGSLAAQGYQGLGAIAIGWNSSNQYQGERGVSIGCNSKSSGDNTVAIGNGAGGGGTGNYSIAIGNRAGQNDLCNNSIILNADVNQLNSDASGFYVNPIRNVPDMSYQLFYDVSRNEIVYAEGGTGFLHTFISSGISLNSTSFTNLNLETTTISNTRLYSKSGNTITILKAGFYQFFFNMPHKKQVASASDYRISVRCAIHQNGNLIGTSSAYSYIRNANNIFNDNCSTSILLECSANDLITLRYQRMDNSSLNCLSETGRFSITKV